MAKGRGSAKASMVMAVALVLCFLCLSKPTLAAIYNVGGAGGWTFNVNSWSNDRSFQAGDILVFNYDKSQHNVVLVDKRGYDSCSSSRGAKVLQSGKDRLTLKKGHNYFICTFPGHCQGGMKIDINAA